MTNYNKATQALTGGDADQVFPLVVLLADVGQPSR
jgi:hypothetical protein